MYQWIVYIHVLAGFAFFLAHGAAAFYSFRIKQETNLDRIRAMLDLAAYSFPVFGISFLVQFLAGIISGFLGNWWGRLWIWLALGLLILLAVLMYRYSRAHFQPLRKALGLPYMHRNKQMPAESPQSPQVVATLIANIDPRAQGVLGFGIPAIILWLMMFKPF